MIFRVFAEGEDKPLRQHQELLQNGEVKYKVHVWNGADVQPGIYTLRSDSPLTPYEIENVEVTKEDSQEIEKSVPFAKAKLYYVFKGETPSKDMRCSLYRLDGSGNTIASSKMLQCDGREISLLEGRYKVWTWKNLGEFEPVEFSVITGQVADVPVQEK